MSIGLAIAISLAALRGGAGLQEGAASASRFALLDGAKVHYESRGEGEEALVFVHGWMCNGSFWRAQLPAFAEQRVIVIDLPGHGASDHPDVDYTMDHFARGIDAVLVDAKVEKAVLVGHSMGTPVIRQFYRRHPEKTLALVIVDGGDSCPAPSATPPASACARCRRPRPRRSPCATAASSRAASARWSLPTATASSCRRRRGASP